MIRLRASALARDRAIARATTNEVHPSHRALDVTPRRASDRARRARKTDGVDRRLVSFHAVARDAVDGNPSTGIRGIRRETTDDETARDGGDARDDDARDDDADDR